MSTATGSNAFASGRLLERIQLTVGAIGATLLFQAIAILPIALLLLFGALWFNVVWIWWLTGAALVFFWWLMQPVSEVPGLPIGADDAPKLHDAVNELAHRMDAPAIDEIRLDDDFNAGAIEVKSMRRGWRPRRILLLGVPLLATLSSTSVRAVLAHELGHFSRRHGRLGHWIYRARLSWLWVAATSFDDQALERAVSAFAARFVPWFSQRAFAHARRCEFEADALAGECVGRIEVGAALIEVADLSCRWRIADAVETEAARLASPVPLDGAVARRIARLGDGEATDAQWIATEHQPSPDDTHPTLAERLSALDVRSAELATLTNGAATPCAGAEWFADWQGVVEQSDARWQVRHRRSWRHEHVVRRWALERLGQIGEADAEERARLELELGRPADALAALQVLPHEPSIEARFLMGAAQLSLGIAEGRRTLEDCIRRDRSWIVPVRKLLAEHGPLAGDERERRRNRVLLDRAGRVRADALDRARAAFEAGRVALRPVPAPLDRLLRDTLDGDSHIVAAWLVQASMSAETVPADNAGLVLRVDPVALQSAALDEEDVADLGIALLRRVSSPVCLRVVSTWFTTEPMPEALARFVAGLPGHAGLVDRNPA